VAQALQYAHQEQLIHRDIKPENMLLGRSNEVLLSDFGIAIMARSSQQQLPQETAGTLAYMAPEQLQGKPRPASDQYALGIVVYEWICGDRPFRGTSTELYGQHLFLPPRPLREKAPAIPLEVEHVILKALAKDPKDRFASVQAFAMALQEACKAESSGPTLFVSASDLPRDQLAAAGELSNSLNIRPHNLPALPTPLIGRKQEVAAACALLRRSEVRLVTLTGPGGVGKTRLGLQVATDLLADFADGICFVPLAPVSDPDLVVPTIAQVHGIYERAEALAEGSLALYREVEDQWGVAFSLNVLGNVAWVRGNPASLTRSPNWHRRSLIPKLTRLEYAPSLRNVLCSPGKWASKRGLRHLIASRGNSLSVRVTLLRRAL
jgi:hypothetical protein